MQANDLVRMANQIADYFSTYPKSEAIDGISKHVHAFWDPRMRNELKAHIDKGGEGLSPLFLAAAAEYFKGPKGPGAPKVTSKREPLGAAPSTAPGGGDGG
jgi:formate dehydrogenase subunit delta